MEIKTDSYSIVFDPDSGMVRCEGSLRLSGTEEYAPIVQLLDQAADLGLETLTINLQKLEFLNSSGINMLSKFVIRIRQRGNQNLMVIGAKRIPWQEKSLKNLKRLMPALTLEIE